MSTSFGRQPLNRLLPFLFLWWSVAASSATSATSWLSTNDTRTRVNGRAATMGPWECMISWTIPLWKRCAAVPSAVACRRTACRKMKYSKQCRMKRACCIWRLRQLMSRSSFRISPGWIQMTVGERTHYIEYGVSHIVHQGGQKWRVRHSFQLVPRFGRLVVKPLLEGI